MYVYVYLDGECDGWISRGLSCLTSRLQHAHRFSDKESAHNAIAGIYKLASDRATGWENTMVLKTEILPDDTPERCVFCNDTKLAVEADCHNCGRPAYNNFHNGDETIHCPAI
jgi:hypothetical protein